MCDYIEYGNSYGVFRVELKEPPVTMGDVVENLVVPVLLASGYHPKTISDYLVTEASDV